MQKRTWTEYNRDLVQRGSLTFLIDPKIFKPQTSNNFGRPKIFSDSLILMLMMVKIHYSLTYRSLEGFISSILVLCQIDFRAPDYSLICKRAKNLKLPNLSSKRPKIIALDASGVKIYGEGEWKVRTYGASKRRRWLKIHIGVDVRSGEIVAQKTTESNVHDSKMVEELLDQIDGSVQEVLADGAYDGKNARESIRNKGAKALIPPRKNGRVRGKDPNRDNAIREIRGLGGDPQARSTWGKLTGYSLRALVETAFSRMKGMFGERLFSRTIERQVLENGLRCLILNRMTRGGAAAAA
jgi:IS5 family transposase